MKLEVGLIKHNNIYFGLGISIDKRETIIALAFFHITIKYNQNK